MASEFFGGQRGILRPFQRDNINDYATGTGQVLLESTLGQLLGTRCAGNGSQGELPWRPEWGCRLYLLRHGTNDAVAAELARQYILEAVAKWLPRVRIGAVRVERPEPAVLLLAVEYTYMANGTGQALYQGQITVQPRGI